MAATASSPATAPTPSRPGRYRLCLRRHRCGHRHHRRRPRQITVKGGADTITAGTGNDRLTIDYSTETNAVSHTLIGGLAAGYSGNSPDGPLNTITFTGVEQFAITTGSGNDVLSTGGGSDVLRGGAGSDTSAATPATTTQRRFGGGSLSGGSGRDIDHLAGSGLIR